MTVFNADNKGFETKKYPLFFGEDMGLFDTVNVAYPSIDKLYHQQMSQVWNEFEVDLNQDKMDMQKLPKATVDLMVKTLSWQWLADSVAGFSIPALILPHCTNSELEGMLMAQSMFEVIHARTYSHIVKQTFVDPNQAIKETYENMDVLVRSDAIIKAFESLQSLPKDATKEEKYDAMICTISALFALEGISFMASFAITFGIVETDSFQGIGALVALIARDEVLHTRMDWTVLGEMFKDPDWLAALERNKHKILEILDAAVMQESDWSDYLFSEGRQVVGLNASIIKEYVYYMAKPLYDFFDLPFRFAVIEENPLPYMDKYIDPSQMQSAAQEINITSYKIGAIADDTNDLDFDDLDI